MKKLSLLLLFIAGSMLVLQSCQVEKRVHRPGYHVEWKKSVPKKQHKPQLASKTDQHEKVKRIEWQQEPFADDRSMVASSSDDLILKLTSQLNSLASAYNQTQEISREESSSHMNPDSRADSENQDLCETIVMTDGRTIMGHVIEITPDVIQYKKCNYTQGPTITLHRKDVDRIIYANGAEDIISGYSSGSTAPARSIPPEGRKLEVMGLLSMIFAIIGLFFFGIILGLLAIIFAIISFGKFTAQPDHFVGRGFAIAGIIIGVVAVVGALLFIASMA